MKKAKTEVKTQEETLSPLNKRPDMNPIDVGKVAKLNIA